MLAFLMIWMGIYLMPDLVPGAETVASWFTQSAVGGGVDPSQIVDIDPATAAVVAVPYWIFYQVLMYFIFRSVKAGQGRENERDASDDFFD